MWLQKFDSDVLGDHVRTFPVHSGVKTTHDWEVEQLPDLFPTTHRVKTRITHSTVGEVSRTLVLLGNLHYPPDIDRTLHETVGDKILQYRTDYNNRTSHVISFMSVSIFTGSSGN